MTNQQLKAHCEDVIANPQDHLDWVVDMARVALARLEAEPIELPKIIHVREQGFIGWVYDADEIDKALKRNGIEVKS